MRNNSYSKLFVLLALMVLVGFGCNRSKTSVVESSNTEATVKTETTVKQELVNLQNSLLVYVPENAAFVFASQHIKASTLNPIISDINEEMGPLHVFNNNEVPVLHWGNSENDIIDAVAYGYDKYFVMHMTVKDENKFLTDLNQWIQKESDGKKKRFIIEQSSWKGTREWMVMQIKVSDEREEFALKLGCSIKDNVASFVLFDASHDLPESVINKAQNSYNAKIDSDKDTGAVVHMDYAKFVALLFSIPSFARRFDEYYLRHMDKTPDDERKKASICEQDSEICDGYDMTAYGLVSFSDYGIPYEELAYIFDDLADIVEDEDDSEYSEIRKHWLKGSDWIKKLETTSTSDAVCINEFKSLFSSIPTSDFVYKADGKNGYEVRWRQHIASDSLNKQLHELPTNYIVPSESNVALRASVGIQLYKAIQLAISELENVSEAKHDCAQMTAFGDLLADQARTLRRFYIDEEMIADVLRDFKSFSIVINQFSNDELPELWAIMHNSAFAVTKIADIFGRHGEVQLGSTMNGDFGGIHTTMLPTDKSLTVCTASYKIEEIASRPMSRDYLFDISVSNNLLEKFYKHDYGADYFVRAMLFNDSVDLIFGRQNAK